jgi:hypothetical protein
LAAGELCNSRNGGMARALVNGAAERVCRLSPSDNSC